MTLTLEGAALLAAEDSALRLELARHWWRAHYHMCGGFTCLCQLDSGNVIGCRYPWPVTVVPAKEGARLVVRAIHEDVKLRNEELDAPPCPS